MRKEWCGLGCACGHERDDLERLVARHLPLGRDRQPLGGTSEAVSADHGDPRRGLPHPGSSRGAHPALMGSLREGLLEWSLQGLDFENQLL